MFPLIDPQKPAARSRSFAHIEILGMISLASPIKVAPFMGGPIFPFSILYASVQEKTNFPEVISTCPPPKLTA